MLNNLKPEDWQKLEDEFPTAMAKMRKLSLLREYEFLDSLTPGGRTIWQEDRWRELRQVHHHFAGE